MRFKLDENLGRRALDRLRGAGHDVDTVADEKLAGAPDAVVYAAAVSDRRILVSLDLDFANPPRFDPGAGSGIVVLRVPDRPGQQALTAALGELLSALERADPTGHLWIVEANRVRQYEEPNGDGA